MYVISHCLAFIVTLSLTVIKDAAEIKFTIAAIIIEDAVANDHLKVLHFNVGSSILGV